MNILNSEIKADESYSKLKRKLLQYLLVSFIAPTSMMPLAPSSAELPTAHKPKIGFSIDSIVGAGGRNNGRNEPQLTNKSRDSRSQRASSTERSQNYGTPSPEPSSTDISEKTSGDFVRRGYREIIAPLAHLHHHHNVHHQLLNNNDRISNSDSSPPSRPIPIRNQHHQLHYPHSHHLLPLGSNSSSENSCSGLASPSNIISGNPASSISSSKEGKAGDNDNENGDPTTASSPVHTSSNPSRTPSPEINARTKSSLSSPFGFDKNSGTNLANAGQNTHVAISGGGPLPPPVSHPSLVGHHGLQQFSGYPHGMLNFAAAAAAAAVQAQHPHPGLPGWMQPHHPPPHNPHPAAAHPLYPWLLAKHSRLFPHRFGPGPDLPGFLLQPFRKPKRIRTAFSPSQLLKLEHAFERNHYVVGAERKQLANTLSLSETQVKVWFQNRRTKHKRMQQEEECVKKPGSGNGNGSDLPSSGSNLSSSAISADSSTRNYSEEMSDDEEIIMDEDYSDEEEMENLHRLNTTT